LLRIEALFFPSQFETQQDRISRRANDRKSQEIGEVFRQDKITIGDVVPFDMNGRRPPTMAHHTTRYANNMLEQSHRAVKQRIRPMLGFKRFASAACFCHAHDEVRHFLRSQPIGHRPAPLAWQRRMRHHQFALLQEMMQAA
jgi:hypothetical protein